MHSINMRDLDIKYKILEALSEVECSCGQKIVVDNDEPTECDCGKKYHLYVRVMDVSD